MWKSRADRQRPHASPPTSNVKIINIPGNQISPWIQAEEERRDMPFRPRATTKSAGSTARSAASGVSNQTRANSLRTTPMRSEVRTLSSATSVIDSSTRPKVRVRLPLGCSAAKTVPATATKMPEPRAS